MVRLMRRVLNGSVYILALEKFVVEQDFIDTCAICQEFENVSHTKALAPYARTAPAFALFDGYSI